MAKYEMTATRCDIILALADCSMRAASAARKLYIDHATVLYHMKLIKLITGKDPKKFYDLADLVAMVKGEKAWTITDFAIEQSDPLSPWAEQAISCKGETAWTV